MKKILFLCILYLCIVTHSLAQSYGNFGYGNTSQQAQQVDAYQTQNKITDTSIIIEINALYNLKADWYTVILNVSQQADSLEACNRLINQRIKGLSDDLQKAGVAPQNIHVDFLSQIPVYEYEVNKVRFSKTLQEIPAGFEQNKNMHIRIADESFVTELLRLAAKYEIYDLVKVEYGTALISPAYDSLRSASLDYLSKQVDLFKKAGFSFDSFQTVFRENTYTLYPESRYQQYTAFSQNRGFAGKIQSIQNASKHTSAYYTALPANRYQIIIAPDMLQPAIQCTYNLQVKYNLKPQK